MRTTLQPLWAPTRPSGRTAATAVKVSTFKPESVKMFEGTNQVNYHCWVPAELKRAEKGDWNWNQQLGFRKVNMTAGGEPKRGLEHPVAWPTYTGYPPTNDPITGQRIDYALKLNGRHVSALHRTPRRSSVFSLFPAHAAARLARALPPMLS